LKKGISAVIATILMLVITIAMAGMAYMYITGVFVGKTAQTIDLIYATCDGKNVTVILKNTGTTSVDVSDLRFFVVDGTTVTQDNDAGCDVTTLDPGSTTICNEFDKNGAEVGSGTKSIRIVGPSNVVSGPVYCP
jgi:flagellin-like protein